MRRRLQAILLAFAALVIAVYTGPLLSSTADDRTRQWEIERTGELAYLVDLKQRSPDRLAEHVITYVDLYREPVLVVDAQRNVLISVGSITADDPAVRAAVDNALRNEPNRSVSRIEPWSREPVLLAQPIISQTVTTGVVVLSASPARTAREIATVWALILAGSLLAVVAFVFIARWLARWLVRPLARLAEGMHAVTAGHSGARVPTGDGPQELRDLVIVFNRMSRAVEQAAQQQRQLVADASHQMRNPLAALRLRVDTLGQVIEPASRTTYERLAQEVGRLEGLLDGLLRMARADANAEALVEHGQCDARLVAADRIDVWTPVAARGDVRIALNAHQDESFLVDCPEDDLAQILDVILDNAIRYGGSAAHVTVSRSADVIVVEVDDNGRGLTSDQRRLALQRFWRDPSNHQSGTGLGLPIALKLVQRRGGTLGLESRCPSGLTVRVTLTAATNGHR